MNPWRGVDIYRIRNSQEFCKSGSQRDVGTASFLSTNINTRTYTPHMLIEAPKFLTQSLNGMKTLVVRDLTG
ncbi:hypothetical protein AYI68_g7926 [Smittium mucronatum]|uniref:Uncharacterized protein n=1 Tax=Smittium mucronatum TaxID=133383 RepID=A0A1R0GMC9_9FUNG|nr:hypothetical protein AYI68_g7926 [Smittium mucronatum]